MTALLGPTYQLVDGPQGRAVLTVPGFPAILTLPCAVRDFHPMPRWQRWLVGTLTPAMTLRNGIALNDVALALADPRTVVQRFLHESCGHWWDCWRIMGPDDFPATYGWQAVLTLLRTGSAHLHAGHPLEVSANARADAILAVLDQALRSVRPVTYDTLTWLDQYAPRQR